MQFLYLLTVILVSLLVYCAPVLIYRFVFRNGEPIENKVKAHFISWFLR